jgi:hypothetical protein
MIVDEDFDRAANKAVKMAQIVSLAEQAGLNVSATSS